MPAFQDFYCFLLPFQVEDASGQVDVIQWIDEGSSEKVKSVRRQNRIQGLSIGVHMRLAYQFEGAS